MRIQSRFLSFFLALVLLTSPVLASGEETTGDYMRGMGTKFVRGIGNILQSPGELGCGIHSEIKKRQAVGAFSGIGVGLALFLRRAFVGVNETATFVIPMDATLPPPCWAQ